MKRVGLLRLVTAACYGAALLITILSLIGLFVVDDRTAVAGGWAFCVAGLFAVGRLAHLARRG